MSSAVAAPRATASAVRSISIATVRATIMPGTSPMTETCFPSFWNRPTASARVRSLVSSPADSAIRVAPR